MVSRGDGPVALRGSGGAARRSFGFVDPADIRTPGGRRGPRSRSCRAAPGRPARAEGWEPWWSSAQCRGPAWQSGQRNDEEATKVKVCHEGAPGGEGVHNLAGRATRARPGPKGLSGSLGRFGAWPRRRPDRPGRVSDVPRAKCTAHFTRPPSLGGRTFIPPCDDVLAPRWRMSPIRLSRSPVLPSTPGADMNQKGRRLGDPRAARKPIDRAGRVEQTWSHPSQWLIDRHTNDHGAA